MNLHRSLTAAIADCVLYTGLFLFIRLWWNPAIYYQYAFCWQTAYVNLHDLRFLADLPLYPGKPLEYPAAILLRAFAFPWLGAAVVTAIAIVVTWLTGRMIAHCGASGMWGLKYLPVMAITLQYVYYTHLLVDSLSIIIALASALAYIRAQQLPARIRIGIFLLLAGAVYFGATHAYVIFVLLCIIVEFGGREGYRVGCAEILLSALLPAVIVGFFFPMFGIASAYVPRLLSFGRSSNSPSLYLRVTSIPNAVLYYSAFLTVPCIAAISVVAGKLNMDGKPAPKGNRRTRLSAIYPAYAGVALSIIIAIGMTGAYARYNSGLLPRHNAVFNYAVETDNWEMLLHEAPKVPPRCFTAFHYFMVNRALYHTGRLLSDLFKFPQGPAILVLNTEDKSVGPPIPKYSWACLAYYELGRLALSENCALESQHLTHNPQSLKLLSSLYVLKGLPEASRVCCSVLQKDPLYHHWARSYLDSLAANPQQVRVMETRRLQSARQMAFEFNVADYLVWRDLDSIVTSVGTFRDLGYPALPRLCEEALLLYETITRKQPDLRGYSISNTANESLNAFGIALKNATISGAGYGALSASFGDSYFYYYLGHSQ